MKNNITESSTIHTSDGYHIYCTTTKPQGKSSSAVVFVHGLLGSKDHGLFAHTASFFAAQGITSLRFDLYSEKEHARPFSSTLLHTQASDLLSVIKYVADEYERVYVIAHSLGAVVTLLAELKAIGGAILWEPSLHPADVFSSAIPIPQTDTYLLQKHPRITIPERLIHEAQSIPSITSLMQKTPYPVGVICAQNAGHRHGKELYFNNARHAVGFHIVKNAGHNFEEKGATAELCKETYAMLQKMGMAAS